MCMKSENLSGSRIKNLGIIADKVIVAFFRVKFHCKTAGVPFRVGRSLFASNGGKACKDFSKLLSGSSSPSTGLASFSILFNRVAYFQRLMVIMSPKYDFDSGFVFYHFRKFLGFEVWAIGLR